MTIDELVAQDLKKASALRHESNIAKHAADSYDYSAELRLSNACYAGLHREHGEHTKGVSSSVSISGSSLAVIHLNGGGGFTAELYAEPTVAGVYEAAARAAAGIAAARTAIIPQLSDDDHYPAWSKCESAADPEPEELDESARQGEML